MLVITVPNEDSLQRRLMGCSSTAITEQCFGDTLPCTRPDVQQQDWGVAGMSGGILAMPIGYSRKAAQCCCTRTDQPERELDVSLRHDPPAGPPAGLDPQCCLNSQGENQRAPARRVSGVPGDPSYQNRSSLYQRKIDRVSSCYALNSFCKKINRRQISISWPQTLLSLLPV